MNRTRLLTLTALLVATVATQASTLTVVVRNHSTLLVENGERRSAYAMFTDEDLVVDVQLDVYKVEQLPSSAEHLSELRQLSRSKWLESLQWRLTDSTGGHVELTAPHVAKNSFRDRGPNAELERDRDATVECRTYAATLNFGSLPPGEFTLIGTIHGISSRYPFEVRTGQEPSWRDVYLHDKAIHAKTYDEYRRLTLERLRWEGQRLDIVLDLIDRSLQHGTLDETRSYVARARQIVDRRRREHGTNAADQQKATEYLQQFENTLPEYFQHRSEWTMTRDVKTGRHVIRSRTTGQLVREVGPIER